MQIEKLVKLNEELMKLQRGLTVSECSRKELEVQVPF